MVAKTGAKSTIKKFSKCLVNIELKFTKCYYSDTSLKRKIEFA